MYIRRVNIQSNNVIPIILNPDHNSKYGLNLLSVPIVDVVSFLFFYKK